MTLQQLISKVDARKPNSYDTEIKLDFINACEGLIYSELLRAKFTPYTIDDLNKELHVKQPYDDMYTYYLMAQLDVLNEEFDLYNNHFELFNKAWDRFAKWLRSFFKYQNGELPDIKGDKGDRGPQGVPGERGPQGVPGVMGGSYGGGGISVKDYGAIGDGTTDDTQAIKKVLDMINEGETIFFPSGVYCMSECFNVTDKSIKIKGSNSILKMLSANINFFEFTGCDYIEIDGIIFDNDSVGVGGVRFETCKPPMIINNTFCNFKDNKQDTVNRHAINLNDTPDAYISNNLFSNIGAGLGGSMEATKQYRSISLNSGSGNPSVINNRFINTFQCVVIGEFDNWKPSTEYTVGNWVMIDNRVYMCGITHTSTTTFDETKWNFKRENNNPSNTLVFCDNFIENTIDNCIYFLENTKLLKCQGNTFVNSRDEAIVVVGEKAIIKNNQFINTSNKCIAIDTKVDVEEVNVSGNTFSNDINYNANFIVYRTLDLNGKVKRMIVENNVFEQNLPIGNASLFLFGLTGELVVVNNSIFSKVGDYQKVIRISKSVDTGNISNNTIVTASDLSVILQSDINNNKVIFENNKGRGRTTKTGGMTTRSNEVTFVGSNAYIKEFNRSIIYTSKMPSSGTWLLGDIAYNILPTPGGNVGWVCTTTGTPGTWKIFGTIEA